MKRFFFSAIALIAAATSCTESGLIDAPDFYGNAIVFDTYIGKAPMTKAENIDVDYLENTVDNGGGIQLFAFKSPINNTNRDYVDYSEAYINGRLVYSSNIWNYQIENAEKIWVNEEAYMPSGKDLAFAAYNLSSGVSTTNCKDFNFTVSDVVANQVDLLVTPLNFVTETGQTTNVPLRFYHLLSRVGFKVLSTGGSTDITISSIKLNGRFIKTGHVDMSLATATPNLDKDPDADEPSVDVKNNRVPAIAPNADGGYASYLADNKEHYGYSFFGAGESFAKNSSLCLSAVPVFNNSSVTSSTTQSQIQALENNRYMMIMPGMVGNLADEDDLDQDGDKNEFIIAPYIEVKYQLGTPEEKIAKIPLAVNNGTEAEPKWENWIFEPGKAYEFIFKITTAVIEFSGVVEGDWGTPESYPEE